MKIIFAVIICLFSYSSSFAQKDFDSVGTHPYIKLTCFPFLTDRKPLEGSFALGPSLSLSGKTLEIQIGLLYDVIKYGEWTGGHYTNHYIEYHKLYFPVILNGYFEVSDKVSLFFSSGPIFIFTTDGESSSNRMWFLLGGGISFRTNHKVKLNLSFNEKYTYNYFSPGIFIEFAYLLD